MTRRLRDDDGAIAVETAIVAPALLVLMLLVVYAGRASAADADLRTAASAAARAASMAATPAAATATAEQVAVDNLHTAGIDCTQQSTTVDTSRFAAGGSVTVTVTCVVSNTDIAMLAVPGTRTSTATSTHPIDTYRGGS